MTPEAHHTAHRGSRACCTGQRAVTTAPKPHSRTWTGSHTGAGVVHYASGVRQLLGKTSVDAPDALYTNVLVELVSDDDITMTATVSNRQGVVLTIIHGDAWRYEQNAWLIDTSGGQVVVTVMGGCGCGGSSVTAKSMEGDMMAGYLP